MARIPRLNNEFIARATQVVSFNLRAEDFVLENKAEIQHLYATYIFKGFDLNRYTVNGPMTQGNVTKINTAIDKLKMMNRYSFDALYDFQPKGVGPGEVLLYVLHNDVTLGGGTSAGVDAKIGGNNYEIKGVILTADKTEMYGFRLGGTVDVSKEVNQLVEYSRLLGHVTKGYGKAEVNSTQLKEIKKEYPKEYKSIVDSYSRKAYSYLAKNPVIYFLNNRGTGGKLTRNAGNIITVKKPSQSDVTINVVTQGGITPRVLV